MADNVFPATLSKQERLNSRKQIDMLFGGGKSHSMTAFPIRIIYMVRAREDGKAPIQVLTSVPKKHFKHAVDRNRVKRQLREAYRRHKQTVHQGLPETSQMLIAFVWLSDRHYTSPEIEERVDNLLQRIAEKLRAESEEWKVES